MNNSVRMAQKHYLQITDAHHLAGCGITPESKAVSPAVTNPTLSETVALLIESWDDLCPEERAVLTALLSLNTSNTIRKS